jgi:hypothetical protein
MSTSKIARRIQGTALLLDFFADAELLEAIVVDVVVVVIDVVVVELVDVVVVLAVVVVAFVVVVAAITVRPAVMPTLPPPQRTPMPYEPGGVDAGIAYDVEKLPLASRVACGPKPSGGNRSDVDVSCAASSAGQPSVGTLPEMVTESPGDAVDGSTVMLAAAEAVATDATNTPITSRTEATIRLAVRRVMLDMPTPLANDAKAARRERVCSRRVPASVVMSVGACRARTSRGVVVHGCCPCSRRVAAPRRAMAGTSGDALGKSSDLSGSVPPCPATAQQQRRR